MKEPCGEPLTSESLDEVLRPVSDDITCVVFMGGDIAPDEVDALAEYIRENYPSLKVGWYSGDETLTIFTNVHNFDFIKLGRFVKKYGPLTSRATNQRFYKVKSGKLIDSTHLFW